MGTPAPHPHPTPPPFPPVSPALLPCGRECRLLWELVLPQPCRDGCQADSLGGWGVTVTSSDAGCGDGVGRGTHAKPRLANERGQAGAKVTLLPQLRAGRPARSALAGRDGMVRWARG
ncbi:hypothetical protein chiPu_0021932, partial [Chiloscyllium punctatum]|nr:hypothetical protein [Chiloscyllium punctatum]